MRIEAPTASERGVSIVAAAIGWIVSLSLAIYTVAVADDVALWIRAAFVVAAAFFTWLLWLAPTNLRVAIVRWLSW